MYCITSRTSLATLACSHRIAETPEHLPACLVSTGSTLEPPQSPQLFRLFADAAQHAKSGIRPPVGVSFFFSLPKYRNHNGIKQVPEASHAYVSCQRRKVEGNAQLIAFNVMVMVTCS